MLIQTPYIDDNDIIYIMCVCVYLRVLVYRTAYMVSANPRPIAALAHPVRYIVSRRLSDVTPGEINLQIPSYVLNGGTRVSRNRLTRFYPRPNNRAKRSCTSRPLTRVPRAHARASDFLRKPPETSLVYPFHRAQGRYCGVTRRV